MYSPCLIYRGILYMIVMMEGVYRCKARKSGLRSSQDHPLLGPRIRLRNHFHRTRARVVLPSKSVPSFSPASSRPRSTSSPGKTLVSLTTRRAWTRLATSSQGSKDCPLTHLRLSRGTITNPGLAGDSPIEKPGAGTAEGGEHEGIVPPCEICPGR